MDRERIPGTATGIDEPRAGPRRTQAESARGRGRPRGGIKTISIDGEWHTRGRIFLDGIAGPIGRLRESTGLPDTPENFAAAEGIGRQKAETLIDQFTGRVGGTVPSPTSVKAEAPAEPAAPITPTRRGRKKRRPNGLAKIKRGNRFYVDGTLTVKGKAVLVRKSLFLDATDENEEAAETLVHQLARDIRDEIVFGVRPSVPFQVAVDEFLKRKRSRPLNPIDVQRLKELEKQFRDRQLNEIKEREWIRFVDERMAGRAAVTRERYIDTIMMLLTWCQDKKRGWINELPIFERVKAARQRAKRRARDVGRLTPELLRALVENAAPHLKAQIAIMWTTGGRVSSLLYGARLCDYVAAEGRETITFRHTKNGDDVPAHVHPWAAAIMREYLAWRGRLHDREGALFLTDRRLPYTDNGKAWGGQTKTAWHWMIKRTIAARRRLWLAEIAALRRQGRRQEAHAGPWLQLREEVKLLRQVTPHWLRHLLATTAIAMGDIPSAMAQAGWRDQRSVFGYAHDVPDRRRALINGMAAPDTAATRDRRNLDQT